MKRMTQDEFQERIEAVSRAEKIFIGSGLTNNITHAFTLYQSVLAEEERRVFINTMIAGKRYRTFMDMFERPLCPDCGAEFMFRQIPENEEGIKIQLVCTNPECDTVLNDIHNLEWWRENLRKKDEG